MLCAIIMAGGVGSRFWPCSTVKKPKQFLSLIGNKTMIQMTYDRINRLIPKENIFIVTNKEYFSLVKEQIKGINDVNIITEPAGKNTAPCILLASLYLKNLYGNTNIICISSDSYIEKEDKFLNIIKEAVSFVEKKMDAIVTLGITPTRPETGYGYIKFQKGNENVKKVLKFVEKPDLEKAKFYLKSNDFLWNAGIFIFNNIKMLYEFKKNDKKNYLLLKDLPYITDNQYEKFLNKNYLKCEKISIDYAIIEKSQNVYTIPSEIGWDDVGSFLALTRYNKKDDNDNILKGDAKIINGTNNIIYGNDKKIILLNVSNIFCIDSSEALIIGNRDSIKDVYKLKDED